MSWEAFVQEHIFLPLGMTRSNFSIREMQENENHALPYKERDGSSQRMPYCDIDNLGPAGSINSSLHDITIWLHTIMNEGIIGDKRLVTEKTFHDMITSQTLVDDPERNALIQSDFITYGLGWFIQSYKGHRLIHHGGSIDGYISRIAFIPSAKIGVVILSNLEGASLAQAVALNVMDRLLGTEQENWEDRLTELSNLEKDKSREARAQSEANKIHNTQPSHRIYEYAGIYEHPAYGILKIEQLDETLQCIYNTRIWRMTHYHYDTFEAHISDSSEENTYLKVSFHVDAYGVVCSVSVPFQEGDNDIVFSRIVDQK
jgi:CubicO group peptidase (beta-lactamase class C family)